MECLNKMKREMSFRSPKTTPILPPELWSHIFRFLSPEDLYSVTKTCPEWNELLEENKNAFLVPLVLPSVMKYVDKITMLKFRRISNLTKNAVDKTLQSFANSDDEDPFDRHRSHYEESSSKRHLRSVANIIFWSYRFTFKDFGRFLGNLYPDLSIVSSNINPFLLRYISYVSDYQSGYRPHVLSILPKFGHHLSSLRCTIVGDSSNEPFHNVVAQLRLVPNIKRLCIEPVLRPRNITEQDLSRASTTVYEFPALPQLVILEVRLMVSNLFLDVVALAMLRQYSKQLVCFTCDTKLFLSHDLNVDRLNLMFPNVRKFHLICSAPDIGTGLEKLSNVSWPLERLHLEAYGEDHVSPRSVISTICNFHKNLEHLKVECVLKSEQLKADKQNEHEEELRKMSKLKIVIAMANNMDSNVFCKFLKYNCQHLQELYIESFDLQYKERGRWALENLRNLEKVVLIQITTNKFHTMRRPGPNETLQL
ncbi:unnamed protein product [Orchesella dallaii]|uniref:F-box domain-containing protein n=1 Tax=Orchesella dallaii TaxID=48710 RepID=A0ABP1QE97_9HEXA